MRQFRIRLLVMLLSACVLAPAQAQEPPAEVQKGPESASEKKKPTQRVRPKRKPVAKRVPTRRRVAPRQRSRRAYLPWTLDEVLGDRVADSHVRLSLSDTVLKVQGPCGAFNYTYAVAEDAWITSKATREPCSGPVRKMVWQDFEKAVSLTRRISQQDATLSLHDENGKRLAVLSYGTRKRSYRRGSFKRRRPRRLRIDVLTPSKQMPVVPRF